MTIFPSPLRYLSFSRLWLVLTMGGTALAAPEASVQALRFERPLQIDGKLDDAAWQNGAWSEGFVVAESGFRAASSRTRFKVGVDAEFLYVGVELSRLPGKDLEAGVTKRDGPLWRDDSIEIMLQPVPAMDQYFHFIVNSQGVIYDALRVQGGSLADNRVDLSAKVATAVSADAWTMEMAIPLAELGLTREVGSDWAINVARSTTRAGGKPEISSFARIAGDLHKPGQFVPLRVESLDATPFLWTLSNQGDSRVVEENGRLMLETTLSVTNRTDSYVFFDLDFEVLRGEEKLGTLGVQRGLDAGAMRLYQVRIPVGGGGEAVVDAALRDSSSRRLLARLRHPVQVNYTPLRIVLKAPSYRNAIYATQKLDALRGTLEINLPADRLLGGDLVVGLKDAAGKSLGETRVGEPGRTVEFALPLPADLPVGAYDLQAVLKSPGTEAPYETKMTLRRLGPPPQGGREVRLDENKVTLVDGKPFLPVGAMMVRPREDLETVAAQGYTAVMEYTFYYWDDAAKKAWLDRLHKLGLMAVIYPYSKPEMAKGDRLRQPMSEEEIAGTRDLILKWKDHPALLAWYLADEPELHSTLPERLRQLDRLCRENDPYHPTIVLNNTPGGIDVYGEFCDILMPNPFPGFYQNGGARRSIEYAYSLVKHAADALGGSRGVWMTPQTFNWADLRPDRANERPPDFKELRNMYYQGIIAGSTGFIPYAYSHGRLHPSIRLGLGYLAKELDILKAGILAPAERSEFSPSQDGILHTLRRAGNDHFLIVVNVTEAPREFSAVVPQGGTWRSVSENHAVTPQNGRLNDTLPPLASRIYTTNAGVARRLDLEKAARLIAEAPVLESEEAPLPKAEKAGLPAFSSLPKP